MYINDGVDREIRKVNLDTIAKFYGLRSRCAGGAKLRAGLFAEDGVKQILYPVCADRTKEPEGFKVKGMLEEMPDVEEGFIMDSFQVWSTDDPNYFWIHLTLHGELKIADKSGPYHNEEVHTLRMEDGLIKKWRVFRNPYRVFEAMDIRLPSVKGMHPPLNKTTNPVLEPFDESTLKPGEFPSMVSSHDVHTYFKYPDDPDLRERNLKIVQDCFSERTRQPGGGKFKAGLFAEDGIIRAAMSTGDPYTDEVDTGYFVIASPAGDRVGSIMEIIQICCTDDPQCFWVEAKGWGAGHIEGYWNHYALFVQMDDEKVKVTCEFNDPSRYRALSGADDPKWDGIIGEYYKYL